MFVRKDTTKASGVEYELEFPQYDDLIEMIVVTGKLDEATTVALRKALKPFTDFLKPLEGIVNQYTKQNATQGNKEPVRKAITDAIKEVGDDVEALTKEPTVVKAIEEHQRLSARYSLTSARGSGLGKTKAGKVGQELRERLGEEKFKALMKEHGISEDEL